MRRLMWFALGFALACALGGYFIPISLWLAAVCGVAAVGLGLWRRYLPCMWVLLGIALGALWFQGYDALYISNPRALDEEIRTLTATASDYSYETDYGIGVDATITLDGKSYNIRLYLNSDTGLKPHDKIHGDFRLRYTNNPEDTTYHRGNGIFLLGYPRGTMEITPCQKIPARYYPAVLRQKLLDTIDSTFPQDTAFFAKALLLGERSEVDYETNTAFKLSGISHIIAVSGLHVSILFALVYLISGRRRILTALIGIPTIVLFAAVAGFTPSITRACVMQILMMLALLFDREYDPPTALSFAALVMLLAQPMVITSTGFQLSVGSMAGIFLFYARIRSWLMGLWRIRNGRSLSGRLWQWLCSGIAVTLSAQFFTAPLVAYYFGTISLVGILTNLLTLWAVSFIFYGIIAICLLSLVWPWAAGGLAWLISWLIRYVLICAKTMAAFPLSAVYTQSVYIVLWAAICYVLILLFLCFRRRQPHVLILCCGIGLCVSLFLSWMEPMLDNVRMTVLDVGQGQCILLQAEGKNYLIDCGGDSDTEVADLAAETLLSQGIARLDGVIVTHFDRDHAGGVSYLLSRVPANAVFLPQAEDEEQLICPTGTEIFVTEDLTLQWGNQLLTVFAPVMSTSSNESGLSVLFQSPECDILITGDMNILGETLLLHDKTIPELTVLVAGHHGSKSSTSDKLLEATAPQYVMISVGENSYGHPHIDVLQRLNRYGCTVYRTDLDGTIIFRR